MSQGFGHPAFPVDTHIHRLAQRWGLTKGKNVTQTEKDLKSLFPRSEWNKLHLTNHILWSRDTAQHEAAMGAFVIFALPAIRPVKTHLSPISPSAFAMLTLHNNEVEKVTKLYGIKNCDTIKKARKWLTENGVEYTFHDVRSDGIDAETIESWVQQVDWETVLNRRGTTWRKLDSRRARIDQSR